MFKKDSFRAISIEQEAIELRLRLIKKCPYCKGRGRLPTPFFNSETLAYATFPCRCARRYLYTLNFLISGVDQRMANEVIYEQPVTEITVRELDLSTDNLFKEKQLYKHYLKKYIKRYKEVLEFGYSFIFIGTNSTGKTFASLKLLHQFLKRGYSGHYIKFRKLMKMINRTLGGDNRERTYFTNLVNEISTVDFLIVDELGKETGSREHISGEIEELLKDRDMGRRPTIIITNERYEDVKDIYTQNIIGAFMRHYKALVFNPRNDMRKFVREEWFK